MSDSTTDWAAIQAAFVSDRLTYRQCAQQFDVPLRTLQYHGSRGEWVRLRKTATCAALRAAESAAEKVASQTASQVANRVATEVATNTAQQLVERHIRESNGWLDTLEQFRQNAAVTAMIPTQPSELLAGARTFAEVVKVARLAHPELAEPPPARTSIQIGMLGRLQLCSPKPDEIVSNLPPNRGESAQVVDVASTVTGIELATDADWEI